MGITSGLLNFTTGSYEGVVTSGTTQSWEFAAGGSFTIMGILPGQTSSQTIFSGSFSKDTFVTAESGGFDISNSSISGMLSPAAASVFSQQSGFVTGSFADLFSANGFPGTSITNGVEYSGNVGLSTLSGGGTVPEPSSIVLAGLGFGIVGLVARSRRRSVPA